MSQWQRLDRRMLLVHPITAVGDAWPGLLGLVVAGSASGDAFIGLLVVPVLLVLGMARYLSTTWRVADDRVEVRRGLVRRETLSTHIDRVRTVDLSASPVHRLLGLTTVVLGTGLAKASQDDGLELNALRRDAATALRTRLLERAGQAGPESFGEEAVETEGPEEPAPEPVLEVVRFDLSWLRYAPVSAGPLLAAGGLAGGAGHLVNQLDLHPSGERLEALAGTSTLLAVVVAAAVGLAALLVVLALTVLSYLLTNHGFRLTRQGGLWHTTRGLLTQRETSIDVERMAGVAMPEPALGRLVGAGRVDAVVTGLRGDGGGGVLLPAAPRPLARTTAATVLGTSGPVEAPLRDHGPAARRRIVVRAGAGGAVVAAVPVVAVAVGAPVALLVLLAPIAIVTALLARDRCRGLGHTRTDGFVVVRSGSVLRVREMLGESHVIGWTMRADWFQRRVGLLDLGAATAAGSGGRVTVPDVPHEDATRLALEATPGLLEPFLVGTAPHPIPHAEEHP